ncbi:hypothetical protein CsSME_00036317 [Camellia sinensis var. sinensis]
MYVVKRDGHQETMHFDKIIARLRKLKGITTTEPYCSSLPDAISAVDYVTNRGELEEAKTHFDRLILMKSVNFKGACNALFEELYSTLLGSMMLVVF